jgi:hypothetical protein
MNQVRRGTGRDTTRPCNTTPHTQTHNTNIQTHTQTDQIRCTQQICRYCRLGRGGVNSDGNYAHARTLFTYLHLLYYYFVYAQWDLEFQQVPANGRG